MIVYVSTLSFTSSVLCVSLISIAVHSNKGFVMLTDAQYECLEYLETKHSLKDRLYLETGSIIENETTLFYQHVQYNDVDIYVYENGSFRNFLPLS